MPSRKRAAPKKESQATLCVRGARVEVPPADPLAPALYQTSSFRFENSARGEAMIARGESGFSYTRLGNPTTLALEKQVAALEGGADAVAFSSGMAAISALVFALVKAGENVVASHHLYGGTHKLFAESLPRLGIEVRRAASREPHDFERLFDSKTRLLYLESPVNPTLEILDLRALAALGRKRRIPVAADNTFATPLYQNPLALGTDAVVHSATKYLGGHGDLMAGVVIVKDSSLGTRLRRAVLRDFGAVLDPFAAWLLLRGLKTLDVRMERHASNALALARWLARHPKVGRVHYPGLPSHPQHALVKRQMHGFGAMLSFEVKGNARKVADACRLFAVTATLGDCESIVTHPASTSHSPYSKKEREKLGVPDSLLRLSVGIEDIEDLKADLDRALRKRINRHG